jgi:signal transduction histidine kinase
MFGTLNPRQHEYMQGILESSETLIDVVNDILDLAVIEAGAMTLDLSDVELSEVIYATEEFAQRPAQKNKVVLRVECPKDIGTVRADEKRIKQIMINLLSNSLAFTSPGDTIIVGAARHESSVELYVEDTGIGIKPEFQGNVFDRFEAHGGSDRRRGAGLGLSLVRSFVELHGGWVTLESAPDVGTRVTCHLPVRAAPPATGIATTPAPTRVEAG